MKVLITDRVHPHLVDELQAFGFEVTYDVSVVNTSLSEIISNYQGIIINSKIIMDKAMIDRSHNLRFIARLGSGMEIIDKDYAQSKGITVINSPEGNSNAVGEHTLGMILSLYNNLNKADREVREFQWNREENRGVELDGKTVGVIGFGHTGKAFARKLRGFDVKILAYDKYFADPTPGFEHVQMTSMDEVLKHSDIISFHLPLSLETYHLCNDDILNACKTGVIIVNTSRGTVVDTPALIKALQSGQVGGACLDVFENEKPQTYSVEENEMYTLLFSFQNIIVSPHTAGWTKESLYKIAEVVLHRILLSVKTSDFVEV